MVTLLQGVEVAGESSTTSLSSVVESQLVTLVVMGSNPIHTAAIAEGDPERIRMKVRISSDSVGG